MFPPSGVCTSYDACVHCRVTSNESSTRRRLATRGGQGEDGGWAGRVSTGESAPAGSQAGASGAPRGGGGEGERPAFGVEFPPSLWVAIGVLVIGAVALYLLKVRRG